MGSYARLQGRFRRLMTLRSVDDVLGWDTATMMPPATAGARAEQTALLRVLQHELLCSPEVEEQLDEAEVQSAALGPWQRANLQEMRRMWRHATAVPGDLVVALSKACSACEPRWRKARVEGDFAVLVPLLSEVVHLVREVATARAVALGCSPYEALIDEYDPGLRCADIDRLFGTLAGKLGELLPAVVEHQSRQPEVLGLKGAFPPADQRKLGLALMKRIGFDFDHGRVDVSAHPFCGGTPDDVRITTRYDDTEFASGLMGIIHETGHALYQRGLPAEWRYQPVGHARGMALHESQSLLLEMQVCRSREFVEFLTPQIREAFGRSGPAYEADNIYRRYTAVRPGFIRVDADEVTYPAHVILRYRLETALISGALEVPDLPTAWAELMSELLGCQPPDDRRGCMQDIHWFDGAFGYFPSYTLGALIAAQLYRAARAQDGEIEGAIGRGDFEPLVRWLREHVHSLASSCSTAEIVQRATGSELEVDAFVQHLERRYLGRD